jgi:hypothetical protein
MEAKSSYTQDEVNEIVRRALDQQATDERVLSHEELVEIAAEAGIDRDALDRATTELAQQRTQERARQADLAEMAQERTIQLKRFGASAVSLSLLNAFFYFVDTHFTGGTWFYMPLVLSGTVLGLRLRHVIFPFDKLLKRRQREEKRRDRERRRSEHWTHRLFEGSPASEGAKRFEVVVQAGVNVLLNVAAKKLERHFKRPGR